jgi:hypothetical protein
LVLVALALTVRAVVDTERLEVRLFLMLQVQAHQQVELLLQVVVEVPGGQPVRQKMAPLVGQVVVVRISTAPRLPPEVVEFLVKATMVVAESAEPEAVLEL